MNKIFISKNQLLKELQGLQRGNKQVLPILTFITIIGIMLSLFLLIPILALWLILFSVYLPFYYVDLFIVKKIYKGNNDD
jgi:hypothetical protein